MIGDVGMMELLVIGIVAVLIFGPDKLPKMIATVVSWSRVLRDQAANARRELAAAADLDPTITDEIKQSVKDIAELHPRRLAASILSDPEPSQGPPAAPPAPARGSTAGPATGPATAFDPDAT
ncbi:MAG: twin-arginine translocase TatA/TatE family subunit [Candidatus Nanopelagicales bacterium]